MEPKFQSSFITKCPVSMAGSMQTSKKVRRGGLYSYIAGTVFVISVILGLIVFGYKLYIKRSINSMGEQIANTEDTLIPSSSREFIRLNNRIISAEKLINQHVVVSPLFDYLEGSTLKSVRFTEFRYDTNSASVDVAMKGEASSYSALALQSDVFSKNPDFKNPVFSDLSLNEQGNVAFTFRTSISPNLISYDKLVEKSTAPVSLPAPTSVATSTATSTSATATSTTNNTPR
jgi:hypothetical protein